MNSKLFWSNCFLSKRTYAITFSQYDKKSFLRILPYSYLRNKFHSSLLYRENHENKLRFNSNIIFDQKRNVIKGGPGYTNFGHKRPRVKLSKFGYFWWAFVFGSLNFILFFDMDKLMFKGEEPGSKFEELKNWYGRHTTPKSKESEEIKDSNNTTRNDAVVDTETDTDNETENDDPATNDKKVKNSFRNRKIIQYENRIRQYSTPDKVFRYFSTLKVFNDKTNEYEIFMTPDDFVRSFTYGAMQPENLGLDKYNKFDPKMQKLDVNIGEESVFKKLSPQGIISFSDYIFLVTLLSTPPRHFEIAFQMFDLDGNGNIDIGEFEELQTIIRNQTQLGQRHRDTRMTGSVIKENQCLNEYFFGPELSQLLTADKFIEFQKQLLTEIIKKEFEYCDTRMKEDGTVCITEESFCEAILAYAGFSSAKTKKILKRITRTYGDDAPGITFEDYEAFFQVLRSIQDIATALKFYTLAGAPIDKSILKHVSKTVANAELKDHVIDVVFNLFDENGDGKLSNSEFIKVMKRRWLRGLQTPKDTGFVKFVSALGQCTKETLFNGQKY